LRLRRISVITITPDAIGRRSALLEIAEVIDRYRAELGRVWREGGVIDPNPSFDEVRRIVGRQADIELATATAAAMKARLEARHGEDRPEERPAAQ
jgi:hypothetical protein